MGKSHKKVKSDRINALRKQYDSFLEEDKKRKERNDYILGRLDKIRQGTAAIQLRAKPVYTDISTPIGYNQHEYQPVSCVRQLPRPNQALPFDIMMRPIDDNLLIQEMSKKYIIIPKLRCTFIKDYNDITPTQMVQPDSQSHHNVNDNKDWRSKYDILDQLNKNEKEEKMIASTTGNVNLFKSDIDKELIFNNDQTKPPPEQFELDKYENKTGELSTKYKHELSEKTEINLSENHQLQNPKTHELNEKHGYRSAHNEDQIEQKMFSAEHPAATDNCEYKFQNDSIEYKTSLVDNDTTFIGNDAHQHHETESNIKTEHTINGNQDIENTNDENETSTKLESVVYEDNEHANEDKDQSVEKVVYLDEDDICPIQVINPHELVEEINSTVTFEGESKDIESSYPIDIINTEEFTPNEEVKLEDGVNINPEGHLINEGYVDSAYDHQPQLVAGAQTEHTDDPADNSGIEAFDAEQREMFYSEPVDENYAYNQEGGVDAYNPEYSQQDTYQQNEEYVYYEGAQAEQYPVEINEHEETSQRYDQHYEQQYENTYDQQEFQQDYDQQSHQPQENQQIEQPESYDQMQQEFDPQYEQLNQDTGLHVEQELDNEQGYVEKHNVEDDEADKPANMQKQQSEQEQEA